MDKFFKHMKYMVICAALAISLLPLSLIAQKTYTLKICVSNTTPYWIEVNLGAFDFHVESKSTSYQTVYGVKRDDNLYLNISKIKDEPIDIVASPTHGWVELSYFPVLPGSDVIFVGVNVWADDLNWWNPNYDSYRTGFSFSSGNANYCE